MSKITLYIDCVSPYTFFAFHVLETYRHVWKDIQVDYVPIVLGIVMKESGNRAPIAVKSKGEWMQQDVARIVSQLGLGQFERPADFPYNSFPAMRALLALKKGEKEVDYINCARALWRAGWTEHADMKDSSVLVKAFASVISEDKAREYVARGNDDKAIKNEIIANTKQVLADGCFGLPWLDVQNRDGKLERYFGNDRWEQIAKHLGVEWKGYELCQETPNARL